MEELISRLCRYTCACVANKLDPDFANAVGEAVFVINELLAKVMDLKMSILGLQEELDDCRNELCMKCGCYKEAYNGACDGCRWKH